MIIGFFFYKNQELFVIFFYLHIRIFFIFLDIWNLNEKNKFGIIDIQSYLNYKCLQKKIYKEKKYINNENVLNNKNNLDPISYKNFQYTHLCISPDLLYAIIGEKYGHLIIISLDDYFNNNIPSSFQNDNILFTVKLFKDNNEKIENSTKKQNFFKEIPLNLSNTNLWRYYYFEEGKTITTQNQYLHWFEKLENANKNIYENFTFFKKPWLNLINEDYFYSELELNGFNIKNNGINMNTFFSPKSKESDHFESVSFSEINPNFNENQNKNMNLSLENHLYNKSSMKKMKFLLNPPINGTNQSLSLLMVTSTTIMTQFESNNNDIFLYDRETVNINSLFFLEKNIILLGNFC